MLPIKLTKVGRTAIYGSWFNFYLCDFTGQGHAARAAAPCPVRLQHRRREVQHRMSTPFRERNPVIIGAISLAVIAALMLAAFKAGDLPLIGGGDTYYAAFSEAGGLKPNDEVRIAGVRVGKVDAVELDGDHVKVDVPGRQRAPSSATRPAPRSRSRRCSARCTSRSSRPAPASCKEGGEIPVARTSSPYDVVEAFAGLAETLRADRHRPARQRRSTPWPT